MRIKNPAIVWHNIKDELLRKNFERLDTYFSQNGQLNEFRHVVVSLSSAQTNYRIRHGLSYKPQDVIVTRLSGAGSVTWNYDEFDEEFIDLTTTGACEIRAFVGTYRSDTQL